MRLWTWHEPGFSLTSGHVDHDQSYYYNNNVPSFPDAYAQLAKHFGTDQIIWCYVRRDDYLDLPELTRVEWALDVPDKEILAIVDPTIWNKILGNRHVPPILHAKWLEDAPVNETACDAYIEQQEKEYHSRQEPKGGLLSQLFITDPTVEDATALLKHPIPKSWVVGGGTDAA